MKTVAAALKGLDENLRSISGHDPKDLGRLHADAAVRHVLALPREFPVDCAGPPTIDLLGRQGRTLTLKRSRPGRTLTLTVTDGEQDLDLDETQATYRYRAFIEHWGEDTDLTAEIRLPPEVKAEIASREDRVDEERRARLEAGPAARSFVRRPFLAPAIVVVLAGAAFSASAGVAMGTDSLTLAVVLAPGVLGFLVGLLLLSRTYAIVVDRERGTLAERHAGRTRELCRLAEVRRADLDYLGEEREAGARVRIAVADGREIEIGRGPWPGPRALEIAESINDAIALPEAQRKLLAYERRRASK